MNSLQPTEGRNRAIRTGILLTALICLSLAGALVVQMGNFPGSDATPTQIPAKNTSLSRSVQESMLPGEVTTPATGVVRSQDYGLWGYTATRGASGLVVDLSYNHKTPGDLIEYVAMNQERADNLARAGGVVDVLVTFRWPVSPERFRQWASECHIEASLVSLRLSGAGGVPGTLTVAGRRDDALPQSALDRGEGRLPRIEGVYSVRGKVPASMLQAIASDPEVFVADVTPTLTRLDLVGAGVTGAQDAIINCDSPFDEVETLDIRH